MRLPTRRGEKLRAMQEEDRYLTVAAIEALKRERDDLETRQRPKAISEVRRLAEMGDFSENFAYQQAKGKLRRINERIIIIDERLKVAIPIKSGPDASGNIRIGSIVQLRTNGKDHAFEILGSLESDPFHGRISHLSPLGAALIGHKVGETVEVKTKDGQTVYEIIEVK